MPARRFIHLPGRVVIILSASLLSSCLPLENPLSDPEKAKPDAQLFGVWKAMDVMGDKAKYPELGLLLIGKAELPGAPPGVMKMLLCSTDKQNQIRTENWVFFPTPIGSRRYINVIFFKGTGPSEAIPASWDKRKFDGYGLFKITVAEDKLVFWAGDLEAAKAAIQKGQLKGTVKEEGFLRIPNINIFGGEYLVKFLEDGGDKVLFSDTDKKKSVFARLK